MLVVNRGLSGVCYVFRGSEARAFLAGLDVVTSDPVTVLGPYGDRLKGQLMHTKALTLVLVFDYEGFSDDVAQFLLDHFQRKLVKGLQNRAQTS